MVRNLCYADVVSMMSQDYSIVETRPLVLRVMLRIGCTVILVLAYLALLHSFLEVNWMEPGLHYLGLGVLLLVGVALLRVTLSEPDRIVIGNEVLQFSANGRNIISCPFDEVDRVVFCGRALSVSLKSGRVLVLASKSFTAQQWLDLKRMLFTSIPDAAIIGRNEVDIRLPEE